MRWLLIKFGEMMGIPSGAKARPFLYCAFGMTEVVP